MEVLVQTSPGREVDASLCASLGSGGRLVIGPGLHGETDLLIPELARTHGCGPTKGVDKRKREKEDTVRVVDKTLLDSFLPKKS